MKSIKNVIIDESNELEIYHNEGYLRIENTEAENYKGIKIYSVKDKIDSLTFKQYSSFSKENLIEFQNILLKAYVFIHDMLDESICKSESKDVLDVIRDTTLVVRKHLRYVTNYIDLYDDILKEFKDI